MKRKNYEDLLLWKQSKRRKPLLIQGARQVGKTWLVNEFGKNEYENFIHLNFEKNPDLNTFFLKELEPSKIIENMGLLLGKKITHENTLIFFDEIQESPRALTSLKYFYEFAPEFHIIAAGSLLGVSIGKESPFPVGKVNFMDLFPMSFSEFLIAQDEELIAESINNINKIEELPEAIHNKLTEYLRMYFFLGGMPEVLKEYISNKDIKAAREIQEEILLAYNRDFSKYTDGNLAIKISEVWNSIPYQLAKENKKFKYADIKKNARSRTHEQTIEWLKKAGLINLAFNISTPKLPLSGYADKTKFKIYLLDTGLLGAMLNISSSQILKPTALFTEYNGAFTENFVASEFRTLGMDDLYYWTSKSDAEVDFIIEIKNKIYPVEVKSGLSKNLKSLRSYDEKYSPEKVYRISHRNFSGSGNFINIPLYSLIHFKTK